MDDTGIEQAGEVVDGALRALRIGVTPANDVVETMEPQRSTSRKTHGCLRIIGLWGVHLAGASWPVRASVRVLTDAMELDYVLANDTFVTNANIMSKKYDAYAPMRPTLRVLSENPPIQTTCLYINGACEVWTVSAWVYEPVPLLFELELRLGGEKADEPRRDDVDVALESLAREVMTGLAAIDAIRDR